MKPGKHQRSPDLGWKVHVFCLRSHGIHYAWITFLLVSSSVRSKQRNYSVHGQGQNSEQKPTTKNFVGFHNHSPPLTMALSGAWCFWIESLIGHRKDSLISHDCHYKEYRLISVTRHCWIICAQEGRQARGSATHCESVTTCRWQFSSLVDQSVLVAYPASQWRYKTTQKVIKKLRFRTRLQLSCVLVQDLAILSRERMCNNV